MTTRGLLKMADAVTVRVPDLDEGLRFYVEVLGHQLKWRNNELGQAGLELPDVTGQVTGVRPDATA